MKESWCLNCGSGGYNNKFIKAKNNKAGLFRTYCTFLCMFVRKKFSKALSDQVKIRYQNFFLEMKGSGNLLRKVEFRDDSRSNGNRIVYGLL